MSTLKTIKESAKWRSTKVAQKVTDPDDSDSASYDYHLDYPRSTGQLKATSDKPIPDTSILRRRKSSVVTKADHPRVGKVTKQDASKLKRTIKDKLRIRESAIGPIKKGAFHAWLGKKAGEPITDADIEKGLAAGGHAAKMANFARNARKFHHESVQNEAFYTNKKSWHEDMREHGATQFEESATRIIAKKPDGDILGAWSIDDDHGITGLGTNVQAVKESLSKSATASDYIDDFVHSKNKKFKGDSKKQRIKRALGAYYSKKNESVQNEEREFLADGKKEMKRKYLGKMRGKTATGKSAHAIDCDPKIDIKKKPGM